MYTVQQGWFAIEDEIKKYCGKQEWFQKETHPDNILFSFWNIIKEFRESTRQYQADENLPPLSQDELESISDAIIWIWRIGTALLALRFEPSRLRESRRLIDSSQFWKSAYVLYIARLFALEDAKVEFLRETTSRTADLRIENELFVECKKTEDLNSFDNMKQLAGKIKNNYEEAMGQIPRNALGLVCLDLPRNIDLRNQDVVETIGEALKGEFQLSKRITGCALTWSNVVEENGEPSRVLKTTKRLFVPSSIDCSVLERLKVLKVFKVFVKPIFL